MNETQMQSKKKTLSQFIKESSTEATKFNKWEDPGLFSTSDIWLKKLADGEISLDREINKT